MIQKIHLSSTDIPANIGGIEFIADKYTVVFVSARNKAGRKEGGKEGVGGGKEKR